MYDGLLRMYDEEATAKADPSSCVMQVALDQNTRPSIWKRKNYSTTDEKVDFYAFYVQKDGIFGPYR